MRSTRWIHWIVVQLMLVAPARLWAEMLTVELPYKGPGQVAAIEARGIEVLARTRAGMLHVYAQQADKAFLAGFGGPIRVLTPGTDLITAEIDANLGEYRTYSETVARLQGLAGDYPGLVSMFSIGTSIEGRTIWAVKLSDNAAVDEDEPEVLYMGCHHARELMAVEMPLRFFEYLVTGYSGNAQVQQLVDEREIFFVPIVNPDGYVYVQNNHTGDPNGWWRKNRRNNGNGTFGVDLNRNYGYNWGYDNVGSSPSTNSGTYRGTAPFSEPETQAVRDFCAAREIVIWLSYHSYGDLFLYPWGYDHEYTTEHAIYRGIADEITATNAYLGGNPAEGAIYLTNGGSDDWGHADVAARPRIFAFTPEVGYTFAPPESLIAPTFDLLLPMNLTIAELAANPAQVIGPLPPVLQSVGGTGQGELVLSWSGNVGGDPNPAVGYEIEALKNPGLLAAAGAESDLAFIQLSGGFARSTANAFQGSYSYYSGIADNLSSMLTAAPAFTVTPDIDTLACRMWYAIESDYDYAYVEVSDDGGLIWKPIAGNVTTTYNPWGSNLGHGITGTSPGWVQAAFPLGSYMGQEIRVRIRYDTDGAVLEEGLYVDGLGPVPSWEARTTMSIGSAATSHTFLPGALATYSYRVRAKDADDDWSHWSNALAVDVDNPTSVQPLPPPATRLEANVPNPFNPRTWLPYTVGTAPGSTARRVHLAVHDVQGRRVALLVDAVQEPGHYRVAWDGRADDGRSLPSGHYFARLRVDDLEVQSRKLALLK
jgi:hypothetical protein